MLLHILESAKLDAYEAWLWYEDKQPGVGDRFYEALEKIFARIEANPQHYTWSEAVDGFRNTLIPAFPYNVYYKVLGDVIYVHSVWHTSREWPPIE